MEPALKRRKIALKVPLNENCFANWMVFYNHTKDPPIDLVIKLCIVSSGYRKTVQQENYTESLKITFSRHCFCVARSWDHCNLFYDYILFDAYMAFCVNMTAVKTVKVLHLLEAPSGSWLKLTYMQRFGRMLTNFHSRSQLDLCFDSLDNTSRPYFRDYDYLIQACASAIKRISCEACYLRSLVGSEIEEVHVLDYYCDEGYVLPTLLETRATNINYKTPIQNFYRSRLPIQPYCKRFTCTMLLNTLYPEGYYENILEEIARALPNLEELVVEVKDDDWGLLTVGWVRECTWKHNNKYVYLLKTEVINNILENISSILENAHVPTSLEIEVAMPRLSAKNFGRHFGRRFGGVKSYEDGCSLNVKSENVCVTGFITADNY